MSACYLLEESAEFLFCFTIKLPQFGTAYGYQVTTTILAYFYCISIPFVLLIEYILEEADSIAVGSFSFLYITRSYVLILTILALLFMFSLSKAFKKVLPFEAYGQQISAVMIIQAGYNLIGVVIRYADHSVGDYDKVDSYQLLYICIFSIFLAFGILLATILINPEDILKNEEKKMRVADRTYTQEQIEPSGDPSAINVTINTIKKPPKKTTKKAEKKQSAPKVDLEGDENIEASIVDANRHLFVHEDVKRG